MHSTILQRVEYRPLFKKDLPLYHTYIPFLIFQIPSLQGIYLPNGVGPNYEMSWHHE